MITFHCSCGALLRVEDDAAGRKVRCPQCREISIASASQKRAGSEEDRPRPRRQRYEDAEHDAEHNQDGYARRRAVSPSRNKGSNKGLIIGLVAGGALLLVAGGTSLYFLLSAKASDPFAKGNDQPAVDKKELNDTEARQIKQTHMNFKQITLSFHNHYGTYQYLPAPGGSASNMLKGSEPLLSWRVKVLAHMEQDPIYRQFNLNEPWDGPDNIKLLNQMPSIYEVPGRPAPKIGHTYVQLVTGPGTAYPTPKSAPRFGNFGDGTSNNIYLVEAAEAVPWTK